MTTTSETKAQPAPGAVRIEWTRIWVRDGSVLFLYDRDTTEVAAVDGGWLFRFRHYAGQDSLMTTQALTFVPDPQHRWEAKEAKPRWEYVGGLENAGYNDRTARMPVHGGWVYLSSFATRGRTRRRGPMLRPARWQAEVAASARGRFGAQTTRGR